MDAALLLTPSPARRLVLDLWERERRDWAFLSPVLGAAFGTQNIVKRRTETILLIRPVVITSTRQAVDATEELRRKMPSLEGVLPARTSVEPPAMPRDDARSCTAPRARSAPAKAARGRRPRPQAV